MNFFSKANKKSKKTAADEDNDRRSPSPTKKSSHRSNREKDENRHSGQGSSRSTNSFARSQQFSPRLDPNTHPLNLPPDQLRRLSALSNMSDAVPVDHMDVDYDVNSTPSASAQSAMPGSFATPPVNGSNGTADAQAPTPPPHKSPPASPEAPPAPTPEDAEAFKTAGNKLYKAKEYKKAIEEYTKGMETI
jgi:DnaJ family protein C protein 7